MNTADNDDRLTQLEYRVMELEIANDALSDTLLHHEKQYALLSQRLEKLEQQSQESDLPKTQQLT